MKLKTYLRIARERRYGMLIVAAQVVIFVVMFFLFVKYVPWVTSHDISEIASYDEPNPPPPQWARAFSVNHGAFTYYRKGPADNPLKLCAIVTSFLILWLSLLASIHWLASKTYDEDDKSLRSLIERLQTGDEQLQSKRQIAEGEHQR